MSEQPTRTALITGAAGNLGRAVAAVLQQQGLMLVLIDRDPALLRQAFEGPHEHQLLTAANLLQLSECERVVQAAVARWGRVDALCNLAGGFAMGPAVHQTTDAAWDDLFNTNVRTVLNMVRATVPRMVDGGGGAIVNIGAQSASRGLAQMGTYCAAKQVVQRISESMAAELAPQKVRVNCVLPSIIDTPQNRAAMPGADTSGWVTPTEIAQAIGYLISTAAAGVSGASLALGR